MDFIITLLARWIISAGALFLVAYIIPAITIESFYIAAILALVMGLLNALIRPILVFFTIPITVLTLGIFLLVINGILFWFPSTFIEGFYIDSFSWAIVGAAVVSVFSWLGNKFIP